MRPAWTGHLKSRGLGRALLFKKILCVTAGIINPRSLLSYVLPTSQLVNYDICQLIKPIDQQIAQNAQCTTHLMNRPTL